MHGLTPIAMSQVFQGHRGQPATAQQIPTGLWNTTMQVFLTPGLQLFKTV